VLLQDRVERIASLELDQEVNAVLVSRLPLVDRCPCIALAVRQRSHWRGAGREDEAIRLILKLGGEHRVNRLLHRRSIACEEHLGLHSQRATRHHHKVATQVRHELVSTPKTGLHRIGPDILIRREERKASLVSPAEGVDIEDTEEVQLLNVLAIHHVIHVNRIRGRDACPGNHAIRANHQHSLVTHDHEETPLAIGLVCDRVACQDVVRTVGTQVATLHRDGIHELLARRANLSLVPLNIRGGQQEGCTLEGGQKTLNVNHQRRHNVLRRCLATNDLHLQLIGGILTKNVGEGSRSSALGLDHREINLEKSILCLPALAVDYADMRLGIHRRAREVPTNLLLLAKCEPQPGLRNVDHVLAVVPKVPRLTLHLELCSLEVVGCADLVDVLRTLYDNAKVVGVREGGVDSFDCRSSCETFDCLGDAVSNVLGLNLTGEDFAFEFGVGILDVGCKVFKVPPCTRREKRLHCHC